ncbi:magnesium transporter [Agrococcus carbonis]|uniref:magnesium transporter n=1 Tax=Agrococcus carbonis TaxID=684552 RepID=UPI001E44C0A4|nr:magnesium transporter [Agrococcus carbonis]
MTDPQPRSAALARVDRAFESDDLAGLAEAAAELPAADLVAALGRLSVKRGAVLYRLLPRPVALEVFEALPPSLQRDLVAGLQREEVAAVFADLDPERRVPLLDELPATVAQRLLRGLPDDERERTAVVLGYPKGSVGRRMSGGLVTLRGGMRAAEALDRARALPAEVELAAALPVVDDERRVLGVVRLGDLLRADADEPVSALMRGTTTARTTDDAEEVARRCTDRGRRAMPIVDAERRLVGILPLEAAVRILAEEESEDAARQGGAEPLRRPYLSTPVRSLVRSRVVWLLVLAIGATLTVQVLEVFETTIEQVTVLALFVPLLIGTGGNTGNQAATTVTRALALDEVQPRDVLRVLARELRVGALLGLLLGAIGWAVTSLVYDPSVGLVIGLTLLAVCTLAASIGGVMPIVARAVRVDPAVFSNPFITTFVDAAGLVVYFLIARAVLQL